LLDGDGWREALDVVHIGLLHHLQELPGVRRQALHVAALTFSINRVEGERRLSRAGKAREHDEGIARQLKVDVLEVMLARAANDDLAVLGHGIWV